VEADELIGEIEIVILVVEDNRDDADAINRLYRAVLLDLLFELQPRLGRSSLLISHWGVIRYFCNRVAVMYRGEVVEIGDAE
jgi:peptide/nickel transport system ATP-binding protein